MSIYNLGGGGGVPVLEQRTVTPSTSQQIIKPTRDEYDGLSQVTVKATPLEARTVNPSKYTSTIFPSDPNIGFSSVTVNGVNLQSKTLTPSTLPYTITPDASYLGLAQATVQKPNTLVAGNIKSGVNIFGVTGNMPGRGSGPNTAMLFLHTGYARLQFIYYKEEWFTGSNFVNIVSDPSMYVGSNIRIVFDYWPANSFISISVINDANNTSTVYYSSAVSSIKGTDGTLLLNNIPIKSSNAIITGTFVADSTVQNPIVNSYTWISGYGV